MNLPGGAGHLLGRAAELGRREAVIHFGGMEYLGPVLNAVPTEAEALDIFDGVVLLARCRDFFELKRSRTSPPVFGCSEPDDGGRRTKEDS